MSGMERLKIPHWDLVDVFFGMVFGNLFRSVKRPKRLIITCDLKTIFLFYDRYSLNVLFESLKRINLYV